MTVDPQATRSTAAEGAPPAVEIALPDRLGHYRMLREIGRGGMGVVWLAHDEVLNRPVAIKLLTRLPGGAERSREMIDGTRAAAAVRAPGLVTLHHVDLYQSVPYLVMELIDGPSVSEMLRACGPLPLPAAAWAFIRVCDAVAAMHDEGVVHRDLKPSNVLVDRDRGPLLTDFGLSVASPNFESGRELEFSPGCAGTPCYMAPECFSGSASSRSDTYALGVMLYEFLAGRPPFDGAPEELRTKHEQASPPAAPLTRAGVPEAVSGVIERALQKNPRLRPRSPRHLAAMLRAATPSSLIDSRGEAEFIRLACRPSSIETGSPGASTPTSPGTYYDLLSVRAKTRRDRAIVGGDSFTPEGGAVMPSPPPEAAPSTEAAASDGAFSPSTPEPMFAPTPTPAPAPPMEPASGSGFESWSAQPVASCPFCGYDQYAISAGTTCPECGRFPSAAISPSGSPAPGSRASMSAAGQEAAARDRFAPEDRAAHAGALRLFVIAALCTIPTIGARTASLFVAPAPGGSDAIHSVPGLAVAAGLQAPTAVLLCVLAWRLHPRRDRAGTNRRGDSLAVGAAGQPIRFDRADDPSDWRRGAAWTVTLVAALAAVGAIAAAALPGVDAPRVGTALAANAATAFSVMACGGACWLIAELSAGHRMPRISRRWTAICLAMIAAGVLAAGAGSLSLAIKAGSARGAGIAITVFASMVTVVALALSAVMAHELARALRSTRSQAEQQ